MENKIRVRNALVLASVARCQYMRDCVTGALRLETSMYNILIIRVVFPPRKFHFLSPFRTTIWTSNNLLFLIFYAMNIILFCNRLILNRLKLCILRHIANIIIIRSFCVEKEQTNKRVALTNENLKFNCTFLLDKKFSCRLI